MLLKRVWSILWVSLFCLSSVQTFAAPATEFADKTHLTKKARLWTEPTKFGEPIAELEVGVELQVQSYSSTGSWLKVVTPGGREGWVPLRFTALAGRRGEPMNGEGEGGGRGLASEGGAELLAKAPPAEAPWELTTQLGYSNQINRAQASGLGLNVGLENAISQKLSLGFGLDFHYFGESSQDLSANAETSRKTIKLFPMAQARLKFSSFHLGLGLGWDVDHTSFDTRDLTTGAPILSAGGGLVSGGEWGATGMFVKIAPALYFSDPKSDGQFGVFLNYYVEIDFSTGSGVFASVPTSALAQIIGLGVAYNMKF